MKAECEEKVCSECEVVEKVCSKVECKERTMKSSDGVVSNSFEVEYLCYPEHGGKTCCAHADDV